jgi:hypothetical protein
MMEDVPSPSTHSNNNNDTTTGSSGKNPISFYDPDDDNDAALQAALALSLAGDTATTTTTTDDDHHHDDFDDDDDDEEDETPEKQLAAALRLSMEAPLQETPEEEEDVAAAAVASTNTSPFMKDPSAWSIAVQSHYQTAQPCCVLDFHYLMWDLGVTTEPDQRRWLCQGVSYKDPHAPYATDSLLAAVISNFGPWGLTQTHGGPCGVLAAIQAEVLRLLLFGPRLTNSHTTSSYSSTTTTTTMIAYPTQVSNQFVRDPPDLSPQLMRQALALAMSLILARAAMTPSATLHDNSSDNDDAAGHSLNNNSNSTTALHPNSPTVQLVLPKATTFSSSSVLEWEHLEPWTSESGGSGLSEHLVTYTISVPTINSTTGVVNDVHTLKRQKTNGTAPTSTTTDPTSSFDTTTTTANVNVNHHNQSDNTLYSLAHATAKFLLETQCLECFERPGGILLFVTSLALSRGIPNCQGDMDDATAKLTSNFGHCSQELINLLLTGQAGA